MRKLIKRVLLFTALLLPVLIFVFLKSFGKNQFDIPVYNHTNISREISCHNITMPHVVGELKIENDILVANCVVNIYQKFDTAIKEVEMKGLMKVKDRLEGEEEVVIYSIGSSNSASTIEELIKKYQIEGFWQVHQVDAQSLNDFVNCELMISGNYSLTLVDEEGRIRGYYYGTEEEIDRLILETKILLYGDEK